MTCIMDERSVLWQRELYNTLVMHFTTVVRCMRCVPTVCAKDQVQFLQWLIRGVQTQRNTITTGNHLPDYCQLYMFAYVRCVLKVVILGTYSTELDIVRN